MSATVFPSSEHHFDIAWDRTGIMEAVTVPPCDDLPYVFELKQGQRLALSFRASAAVDVVICPEGAYDSWVDDGMNGDHPAEYYDRRLPTCSDSLFFAAPHTGLFVLLFCNAGETAADLALNVVW